MSCVCGAQPRLEFDVCDTGMGIAPEQMKSLFVPFSRLIAHLLRHAGADVIVVENGRQAVDAALVAAGAERPFDVILMDMQMPVLDGYQATTELREVGYRGKILALTAHAMQGDREKCLAAGCDDFIAKPVSRAELIAGVIGHLPPTAEAVEMACAATE